MIDDDDDVMAEDFIPDGDNTPEEVEEVDIYELLFSELTEVIDNGSSSPALTEWLIGERLRRTLAVITDNIKAKKAFEELQKNIAAKFGEEYTIDKLYECLKLADEFPDMALFSEIANDLSLDHLKIIVEIESDMARTFYCELARQEKWNTATLKENIVAKKFETEFGED
jgi:hypothetical protein